MREIKIILYYGRDYVGYEAMTAQDKVLNAIQRCLSTLGLSPRRDRNQIFVTMGRASGMLSQLCESIKEIVAELEQDPNVRGLYCYITFRIY